MTTMRRIVASTQATIIAFSRTKRRFRATASMVATQKNKNAWPTLLIIDGAENAPQKPDSAKAYQHPMTMAT